jgi:acyl-CoA thioester hydrolase
MHEGNLGLMRAFRCFAIDHAGAGSSKVIDRSRAIVHREREVMQPRSALGEKTRKRRVRSNRADQFDAGFSGVHHLDFDSLVIDDLTRANAQADAVPPQGRGFVEVLDRNGQMIDSKDVRHPPSLGSRPAAAYTPNTMMQAPQVPLEEEFRFRCQVSTRWSDEDLQGVLNNAIYATLCEEARYRYFEQLQLLAADRHFPFVLLQSNIRYLAPGTGASAVEISVRTVHLGSRSFRQAYRIREKSSGVVWAEAEAVLVLWDPATRSSAEISPAFRAALSRFEGLPDAGESA